LPTHEDYQAEFTRLSQLAADQRKAGRVIVVVVGFGLVGPVMAAVEDEATDKTGRPTKFVIGVQRPSTRSFWKIRLLSRGVSTVKAEDPKVAQSGDAFVQKAPAVTVGQLARVLNRIFNSRAEVRIIGTRHGEKNHESLLNREEMVRAEDLGAYYRIGSDTRDLKYSICFEKGQKKTAQVEDYTSADPHQLTDEELADLLLNLPYIQEELKTTGRPVYA
jgi:hypothetical protein